MFNVCNVLVLDDREKEKYNIENLIQFDKNGVKVESLKAWFDCSSSIVWKPQLSPPVLSKDMVSPSVEITTNERSTNLNHTSNQLSRILKKTEKDIPSISPLLKKYLKKDMLNYDTKSSSTKIKWQSSLANARKMLKNETKLYSEKERNMIEKLKERASCFSSNCRGKWVILASSLGDGYTLENFWSKLSDELYQGLFQNCNITFQTDPDCILIYTNFLSSTMVPKVFTSISKMVKKMSYVVHPCGQVLCWNGEEVIII